MKIESIRELRVLAINNQEVYNILADSSIGRRKAADLIRSTTGDVVSEKLVRTWRSDFPELSGHPELDDRWDEFFTEPEMPAPSGPTKIVNALKVYAPGNFTLAGDGTVPFNHEDRLKPQRASDIGPEVLREYLGQIAKEVPTKRPMVKTSKTIVVMPDVQAPLQDNALIDKFIQFLADYEPDELAQVGDFTDSTEISRWVRGKAKEYTGDLKQGFKVSKSILEKIREVFDGQFRIVRSNHDDRLEIYIEAHAAGLASFLDDELTIERLAGFNEFDVQFVRDGVVELTPQARDPWIMCHGDEGSLNQVAGRTAFNLAKNKFGANVICGHTHRAGLTSESYGYNGKIRDTRYGLEVGHFMDLTKADYLKKKGVGANWQQAFGILHLHGSKVYPQLVSVDYDGNFSVEGRLY